MAAEDWRGRRVLVTGGRGFLGRRVVRRLEERGARVEAVGRAEADLRDRDQARALFRERRPEVVVHCAVEGGGIGWMRRHPVEATRDNALINVHALDAAAEAGARLFVGVSSACAYPRDLPVPFREEDLWKGRPEPTNAGYAESKRLMMELGGAMHETGRLAVAFPVLANLYGPGDATELERAHVVAALVIRALTAPPEARELRVWGSGRPTRELLHVADAADGVLAAAEHPSPEPVNIGTGVETSIAELARAVVRATGRSLAVRFDPSQPDGQPRKCLAVDRARERLGWVARIDLDAGLADTVAWYRERGFAPRGD